MAPFFVVTDQDFGGEVPEPLSYLYQYTLERRAEDGFDSQTVQRATSASVDPLATEFRGPTHTAGASWHNAHELHSLKHLSIWAYLAFGFIVLWVPFVVVYGCFRCCRANIVRLDAGDDEISQVWRKRSVATRKRKGRPRRWGRKGEREISAMSSEVQFLRCSNNVGEANLGGKTSWDSSAASQGVITGYGRSIFVGLPPGLGSTSTVDINFPGGGPKSSFASGVRGSDDPGKAVSVDLFNTPFALPRDSESMSGVWREPKLSPVRGSIIRPEPAITVASRKW